MTADLVNMSNDEQSHTVSVVIPAYNEATRITPVIDGALLHVDTVLVINDGSSDNTEEIAKKAMAAWDK